jgi:hypothetical protein
VDQTIASSQHKGRDYGTSTYFIMGKKKKSSAHPTTKSASGSGSSKAAAAHKSKAAAATNTQSASGKNNKVKESILGFLPVSELPHPPLPSVPKLSNIAIHDRVFGGWELHGNSPRHPMELGGDRTLDFNIMLGIDRRCPQLPIWMGNVGSFCSPVQGES